MPKRTYVGSHAAVEVPLPNGEWVVATKGVPCEFPEELAVELESGPFVVPGKKSKTEAVSDD